MIDLAHEEVLPFFPLLAFCNISDGADEGSDPSLMPNALKISKSMSLYPADFTVLPLDPILMRVGFWIGGIERRLAARPKQFRIVRMHPLLDFFNRHRVGDDIENFLKAPIPRDHAVERIVLPPPEPGCTEGELESCPARPQSLLRLLARAKILRHDCVAQRPTELVTDSVHRCPHPDDRSIFTDIALFHIENVRLSGI